MMEDSNNTKDILKNLKSWHKFRHDILGTAAILQQSYEMINDDIHVEDQKKIFQLMKVKHRDLSVLIDRLIEEVEKTTDSINREK